LRPSGRGAAAARRLPHVLGYKGKRLQVLVYQYAGDSVSGLADHGAWRLSFLDDIWSAELTDGAWHSSPDYVIEAETSFDYVECQARPCLPPTYAITATAS
jgi:hypothetical protein